MKNYFTKNNKKAMKEYGFDLVSKFDKVKKKKLPFKPKSKRNNIWRKIKKKLK